MDERHEELLLDMARMFEAWDALDQKSNEFLAALLMEHVISDTEITSPRFALFSEIYARLKTCPDTEYQP